MLSRRPADACGGLVLLSERPRARLFVHCLRHGSPRLRRVRGRRRSRRRRGRPQTATSRRKLLDGGADGSPGRYIALAEDLRRDGLILGLFRHARPLDALPLHAAATSFSLAELLGRVEALIVLSSPRVFTRARQRSRVDHIKSRLKASTLPKKDTACSRSYSQQRLLARWTCASRISTPAFAAEVLSTTIAATRCKTDTACSRSYSQRRLLGDGPARRASRRARVRGRGALNTTRSRPARAAAAGGGLDSPALPGALFLNRCACAKARLARSS